MLLAEQIATLAAITPGRFIMQCGLGWEPHQSAGMGVDIKQRAAMFETSVEVMQRLWAGETVSENRFWNIQDAHTVARCPRKVSKYGWGQVRLRRCIGLRAWPRAGLPLRVLIEPPRHIN